MVKDGFAGKMQAFPNLCGLLVTRKQVVMHEIKLAP